MPQCKTPPPSARPKATRGESRPRPARSQLANGPSIAPKAHRPAPARTTEVAEDRDPPTDEELLGRYRDGHRPDDFAELLRRHSDTLRRFLIRYLGDATLAEDVLQDTFLQVHAKCGRYRDGWPARPWLYTVALHRAVDALRKCGRLPTLRLDQPYSPGERGTFVDQLASNDPGPFDELYECERGRWVRERVALLPEPLRLVVSLAYDQGLAYAEIAGQLGIPLGTVKSRLHGAIGRLREMAERYEPPANR